MAKDKLSVRIGLEGDGALRKGLEAIGETGTRAFEALRSGLKTLHTSTGGIANEFAVLRERIDNVGYAARRVGGHFSFLRGEVARLGSAILAAFSVRALANAAVQWQEMTVSIQRTVLAGESASDMLDRLVEIANRSGETIKDVADSYATASVALRAMGVEGEESIEIFEAVRLVMANANATTSDTNTLLQILTKAMAEGVLKGRQFQKAIELSGSFAEMLAQQLGVPIEALGRMASEGRITGQIIRDALTGNLSALQDQADETSTTIVKGFNRVHNSFLQWIGTADEASGVSAAIARALDWVAKNFDAVARTALAVLGVFVLIKGLKLAFDVLLLAKALVLLIPPMVGIAVLMLTTPWGLMATGLLLAAGAVLYLTGSLDGFVEKVTGAVKGVLGFNEKTLDAGKTSKEALDQVAAAAEGIHPGLDGATKSVDGLDQSAKDLGKTASDTKKGVAGLGVEGGKAAETIANEMKEAKEPVVDLGAAADLTTEAFVRMAESARAAASAAKNATGGAGPARPQQNRWGGKITGPGTGTSDSILSYLSNGEYVVQARAVRQYGTHLLDMINGMSLPKRAFATGGMVGAPSMEGLRGRLSVRRAASTGLVDHTTRVQIPDAQSGPTGRPLTLSLDGQTFEGLTAPEDVATKLTQYATQRQMRRAGKMPSWYRG